MGKQEDEIDDLKLAKSIAIKNVKLAARKVLSESDFYVIRSMENGKPIPLDIMTARDTIRKATGVMEYEIGKCANLEEIKELDYTSSISCSEIPNM